MANNVQTIGNVGRTTIAQLGTPLTGAASITSRILTGQFDVDDSHLDDYKNQSIAELVAAGMDQQKAEKNVELAIKNREKQKAILAKARAHSPERYAETLAHINAINNSMMSKRKSGALYLTDDQNSRLSALNAGGQAISTDELGRFHNTYGSELDSLDTWLGANALNTGEKTVREEDPRNIASDINDIRHGKLNSRLLNSAKEGMFSQEAKYRDADDSKRLANEGVLTYTSYLQRNSGDNKRFIGTDSHGNDIYETTSIVGYTYDNDGNIKPYTSTRKMVVRPDVETKVGKNASKFTASGSFDFGSLTPQGTVQNTAPAPSDNNPPSPRALSIPASYAIAPTGNSYGVQNTSFDNWTQFQSWAENTTAWAHDPNNYSQIVSANINPDVKKRYLLDARTKGTQTMVEAMGHATLMRATKEAFERLAGNIGNRDLTFTQNPRDRTGFAQNQQGILQISLRDDYPGKDNIKKAMNRIERLLTDTSSHAAGGISSPSRLQDLLSKMYQLQDTNGTSFAATISGYFRGTSRREVDAALTPDEIAGFKALFPLLEGITVNHATQAASITDYQNAMSAATGGSWTDASSTTLEKQRNAIIYSLIRRLGQ